MNKVCESARSQSFYLRYMNMKYKAQKDIGFGTRSDDGLKRALNKDGSFNVKRAGQKFLQSFELYHWLVSISWKRFMLVVFLWYFIINLLFALLYVAAGVEHLTGIDGTTPYEKFWEAFFFSSQTLTTLGYGRVAPMGFIVSSIAAIESMIGLMVFALITGLLYGRFSRPVAKILFSENAVIAPYRGIKAFMFRIVNQRTNQLIETEVELVISMQSKDGTSRIFETLSLERNRIQFFPLSWTVVHPIDEQSLLFGMKEEDFRRSDAEFIIMLKTFDDTFSQTVYSRSSYRAEEVIWDAKFISMIDTDKNGSRKLMLDRLNSFEKIAPFETRSILQ